MIRPEARLVDRQRAAHELLGPFINSVCVLEPMRNHAARTEGPC